MKDTLPIEVLPTGNTRLDHVLGGGIPARSINVIAGTPGSGKTVFVMQLVFALAREGKKTIFFTTLSEPAVKLIRYIHAFPFFDEQVLDSLVQFVDISSVLRTSGMQAALDTLVARVEQEQPTLVVIDSFKALGDLFPDTVQHRTSVYDLSVQMAVWGATTFLVGEYSQEEVSKWPEFAIADGILLLTNRLVDLTAVRELQVLKLRGANYVTGAHFFEIGPAGISFYPRVRAPQGREEGEWSIEERASSGVEGFDELVDGGLPRGSATVIQGGSGTGKTLFGLNYVFEGLRRGETAVLFTLEETPQQLRAVAKAFGMSLEPWEAKGKLHISYASPVELSTDRYLNEVRAQVERLQASRLVLDGLTSLALGVPSERRFKELVYALTRHMRAAGATMVATMEIPELLGSALISGHGISFAADNLIQLRYVDEDGRLERALLVIKVRGVNHATQLHRLKMQTGGLHVGPAMTGKGALLPEATKRGAKP
jgi:circadian clock protein KaiC